MDVPSDSSTNDVSRAVTVSGTHSDTLTAFTTSRPVYDTNSRTVSCAGWLLFIDDDSLLSSWFSPSGASNTDGTCTRSSTLSSGSGRCSECDSFTCVSRRRCSSSISS